MSKSVSGNRRSKKQTRPDAFRIAALIATVVMAAVPFGLGKYMEFNTDGAFDSGAYIYSAKHILDGARMGTDEKPSAQMGTLLLNMLGVKLFGFNETGPKLIQMIFQLSALVMMFISMRKLFGSILPASVGVIVASYYLSCPHIAKYGNVKEQYMIACMVIGISCFILRQTGGGRYMAVLAGAFLSWSPLFKETGFSAPAALALFVIAQPILRNMTVKQTACEIGLLLAGAALAVAPVYIWLIAIHATEYMPYKSVIDIFISKKIGGSYITNAREQIDFAEVTPRVFRYYGSVILPAAMAVASIIIRLLGFFMGTSKKNEDRPVKPYERFVLLLAVWWILDMAFVWVSPRSFEEYYLPLTASGAMLGGYLTAKYQEKLSDSTQARPGWIMAGLFGIIVMITMAWPIFFGFEISPHSGKTYNSVTGERRRGYIQRLEEISRQKNGSSRGDWENAGDYIRKNSTPADKIYVWGWYPGIYVKAQRLSPAAHAFTSEMHVVSPAKLSEMVKELLDSFAKERPKFIVDTHKWDFPWDRPPLELWPKNNKAFMPSNDKEAIEKYDTEYTKFLSEKVGKDEADRYISMWPFREFIMQNYTVAMEFGQQVVFELKNPPQETK